RVLREAMIMALCDLWDVEDYDVDDIAICGRRTPNKLGYHLIMTRWSVPDMVSHRKWIAAVKEAVDDQFAQCIDNPGNSLTLPGTYKNGYCLEPMTDHTMHEFMITYPAEIVLESLGDVVNTTPVPVA